MWRVVFVKYDKVFKISFKVNKEVYIIMDDLKILGNVLVDNLGRLFIINNKIWL